MIRDLVLIAVCLFTLIYGLPLLGSSLWRLR